MPRPSWMPVSDWQKVVDYANRYGTVPELLAAIGWHETHWGRLGWGRYGFHLGVGCYSEREANYRFQGLDNQLRWAARQLGRHIGRNVTLPGLISFARNVWRPGNPEAWARSVYRIYRELGGPVGGGAASYAVSGGTDIDISVERELRSIEASVNNIRSILRSWIRRNC